MRGLDDIISIHALRAESDDELEQKTELTADISIHALRAESDGLNMDWFEIITISIHALRAESDSSYVPQEILLRDFNPRSPCGERQQRYTVSLSIFGQNKQILQFCVRKNV